MRSFLGEALRVGPDGFGFIDQVAEAAGAADGLLLHERRDLMPALQDADWAGGTIDAYLTTRDTLSDDAPLEQLVAPPA